jgi:hypothetical protein
VVGGGVHGKGNGTARGIMIQVGAAIKGIHLFIEVYPQLGGMTTGRIGGKGIRGINKEYPTKKFNRTGGHGKKIIIGRSKIVGVFRVIRKLLLDQNKSLEMLNKNDISETMKEEEIRKS